MRKAIIIAGAMLIMTAFASNRTLADDQVVEEWVARYDNAGGMDYATAMAMDDLGNVYVTGISYNTIVRDEFCVTIKYGTDNNEPLWVALYETGGAMDFRSYIAVDGSGNVYVAGTKVTGQGSLLLTIKYDPDGNEVWVSTYDGLSSQDIAVDNLDNIYVTCVGYGNKTDIDYATVKYAPDSNEPVWIARYNGPGNDYDRVTAIAIDNSGNVYVKGVSDGNSTGFDYATIKYSSDSNEPVWVARYNGIANSSDWATAIATDDSGNVYVAGYSDGGGTGYDYATIKYDPDNNEPVWVARYDGPISGNDWARAIAVDALGSIYVTGNSFGIGTEVDYATIKYSADSNEPVWVARYNGPANNDDGISDVVIDHFGNIYVTGYSSDNVTSNDYTTIRYGPESNEPVWIVRYNGPANDVDWAEAIAVDDLGNVYVTGRSQNDYATVKYSQPGYIKAGVSVVFNGSFENPGWLDNGQIYEIDISQRPPKRWCDVNLPTNFVGRIRNAAVDWHTKGEHSLTLYSKAYKPIQAGDIASVSQQVYLEDVNTINFDFKLRAYGMPWKPDNFRAVLLIDGDEVWDSNTNTTGEYLDQQVTVDQIYKDAYPHTLSLGLKARQTVYDISHEVQWDFVRFNTHNDGGYGGLLAGDFNYDGEVNTVDLEMFAQQWLSQEPNEEYDLFKDDSNTVNFPDFAVFADDWMSSGSSNEDDGLLAADLNDDGIVNFLDLAILAGDWNSEGICITSDIDGTGAVDYGDVEKLSEQWLEKSWLYGLQ